MRKGARADKQRARGNAARGAARTCEHEHALAEEHREEADPPEVAAKSHSHIGIPPVLVPDAAAIDEVERQSKPPDHDEQLHQLLTRRVDTGFGYGV